MLPPYTDRFSSNYEVIKEYPYDVISEDNKSEQTSLCEAVYYFHPISGYDVMKLDKEQG